MTVRDVDLALKEAERFLARCFTLQAAHHDGTGLVPDRRGLAQHAYPSSRYTAAVRRASLDLTRALAELRRR